MFSNALTAAIAVGSGDLLGANSRTENKNMKLNWDEIFRDTHLNSWPTAGLSIQNVNPSPSQGSRNIFKDDKDEIMAAAKKYGYQIVSEPNAKVVTYSKAPNIPS